MTAPTGETTRRTWRSVRQQHLWPSALLLAVPAALAVLNNHPNTYVGDNRFEQYWAPGWRIVRESMLWDGTRGMGRIGEEFWPITMPLAFLRALGLSPAATEHTWHATLLLLAGLGALSLVRVFQPRIGGAHLLAGLIYMCNPFSITFLVPSNLYLSYVLAPWLLICGLNGVRAPSRRASWRWAALWALLIYVAGDTDLPGLMFTVLWLIPMAVFAVAVERWVTWKDVRRWVGRAAVLTMTVSAAAAMKIVFGAGALGQRLLYTENPLEVNGTSSWTESFRGLGYWLSYYSNPGRDADVPGSVGWYESAGGVVITFVLPILALVVLWRLRWRVRLMFVAIAIPSLIIMVGSFPPVQSHPAGRLLLTAYRSVPSLSSFRNTYKAGSGLMLAVAVLIGIGSSALGAWSARRRHDPALRPAGAAALVGIIALVSLPMWTGSLYPADKTMQSIPGYWRAAATWVERQPGDSRVLVLPGSTQTAYRWGWAGDDILDSLFHRHPNVVPTNFPVSGVITANVIDSLERRISEGTLTPKMLVPIAQRLGIGYVLIRNDLDWARIRDPRPALLDELRSSPLLPLARTFGPKGEFTADPDDLSEPATGERRLPPIEIYRVPGVTNQQLARKAGAPLLVDGDGDAWPTLAADGDLAGGRALRFAGAASDEAVTRALDGDDASLVVTDTNRRRLTLIRGPGPTSSETLSSGQILSQAPEDTFLRPDTQSVAVFPDATSITASGSGSDLSGFSPSVRAANAFDGLPRTAWRDGGYDDAVGRFVKIEFREPRTMSQITLTPFKPDGGGRIVSKISLNFSDGSRVLVDLPVAQTTVRAAFPSHLTTSLEIRIEETVGDGTAAVGFNEISIPGIDLQEYIATPSHLFTSDDPELRAALVKGDVSYLFRRSIGTVSDPEELRLRRQFTVAGTRTWTVHARLAPTEAPLDALVDALVGGPVGAYGSSRVGSVTSSRGGLAVDPSPTTAWAGLPVAGTTLTVRVPEQRIATIRITLPGGPNEYPARQLSVRVGNGTARTAQVVTPAGCTLVCVRTATLQLPVTSASLVRITLLDGDRGSRPVRISDVTISGPDGTAAKGSIPRTPACTSSLVTMDGQPLALRTAGPLLSTLEGGSADLVTCEPVRLKPGAHRLATTEAGRVDEVRITPSTPVVRAAARPTRLPTATVTRRNPTSLDLRVKAPTRGIVITGMSFDKGWKATADGRDLGLPFELEGQSAWEVPAGTTSVQLVYGPQRLFSLALVISASGLVLCAWLVFRGTEGPRRRSRPVYGPPAPPLLDQP